MSLSPTLVTGLTQYKIGPKIRELRLRKKLGLVELGKHTGLSSAMLSKIERGQLFPTLPTLLRIALVFGVGLEHFFAGGSGPAVAVVRKNDRVRLPAPPEQRQPSYHFESLDFPVTDRKMTAYFAEFPVRAPASPPHQHDGAEIIYVMSGELVVTVDGKEHTLAAGDAMYFESHAPHTYRGAASDSTTAVVVVTS